MSERHTTMYIVVHCSATPFDRDIGAEEIRKWHTDPAPAGNGWSDIGYHLVIRRDGRIEPGRPLNAVGAHVKGKNGVSVGVCLVGGLTLEFAPHDNFTRRQYESLHTTVEFLRALYPDAEVLGHRDFDGENKACPCFSVQTWAAKVGITVNPTATE